MKICTCFHLHLIFMSYYQYIYNDTLDPLLASVISHTYSWRIVRCLCSYPRVHSTYMLRDTDRCFLLPSSARILIKILTRISRRVHKLQMKWKNLMHKSRNITGQIGSHRASFWNSHAHSVNDHSAQSDFDEVILVKIVHNMLFWSSISIFSITARENSHQLPSSGEKSTQLHEWKKTTTFVLHFHELLSEFVCLVSLWI